MVKINCEIVDSSYQLSDHAAYRPTYLTVPKLRPLIAS